MQALKRFIFSFIFIIFCVSFIGCSDNLGGGISHDNSANSGGNSNGDGNGTGGGDTLTEINLEDNPLSLIGAYRIDNYSIAPTGDDPSTLTAPDEGSQLRVNFNMDSFFINLGFVIKPDAGKAFVARKVESVDITGIFTGLGAKVVDKTHLRFTMTGSNYPELVSNGIIEEWQTLTVNLTKMKDLGLGSGFGSDFEVQPEPIKVTSITMDQRAYTFNYLNTPSFKINAQASPSYADNTKITFTSSDETVATVDATGLVTMLKVGVANITATSEDGGASSVCEITVIDTEIYATSASFLKSETGVARGATLKIQPVFEPISTTIKTATYSSSDPSSAYVDPSTGEVKGLKLTGQTPVTITAEYTKEDRTKESISYILHVFTPVDFSNPATLVGSYDMTFFGTYPKGKSSFVEVPVTSDCTIFSTLFAKADGFSKACTAGVKNNEVENFHGLVAIENVLSSGLFIKSKVMMTNSTMKSMAKDDQYQYSEYHPTNASNVDNNPDETTVKGVKGRNLTGKTSNLESTFQLMSNSSNGIRVDMILKGKKVIIGTVDAHTKVFATKYSDIPRDLKPNSMDDKPFNKIDGFNDSPAGFIPNEPFVD